MAGILATGRTPAYAQQKTVHWLKWVDFVPATDQMFNKELMPQAEKDPGIKMKLETVNGNDLQPRITRRHPVGRRSRPDHVVQQLHPSLCQQRRRHERAGRRSRQARGRALPYAKAICSDGKMFMGMPWAVIGGMIAYRKSWFDEIGVDQVPGHLGDLPRGRQEAEGQGPAVRPDARATRSATRRASPIPTCGRGAARKSRPTARPSSSTPRRRSDRSSS